MTLQSQIDPLFAFLADETLTPILTDDLPLVGNALADLVDALSFSGLETAISDALATAETEADPTARAAAIELALNALGPISATSSGTVVDITLSETADAVVDILSGDVALGGSNLGLEATADMSGMVSAALNLTLSYDTATDTLTVTDTAGDEMSIGFSIAADVSAAANLGLLTVAVEDSLDTPEIALSAGINLTGLSPADVEINFTGGAALELEIVTEIADDLLPGIYATFGVDWSTGDLSLPPTITFDDVGVEVGTLVVQIDRVLEPVTDFLFEGIIGKIIDTITEPVPIIDDGLRITGLMSEFDEIPEGGDGIFNLLDGIGLYLAANNNDQLLAALSAFAEAIGVLKQLEALSENDGRVSFGSFDLNSAGTLSGLTVNPNNPLDALSDLATGSDLFNQAVSAVTGVIQGGISSLSDTDLSDESGLSFPLFEDPAQVLNILFPDITGGGTVSVIEYDMPALTAEARFGEYFFRIFGPFGLTLDGFAGATVDFQIGYDTQALETGVFADGLYLTTQEMEPGEVLARQPDDLQFEYRPFAHASAGVFAGIAVDAFVVRVGAKGGITGFAAAFLPGGEVEDPADASGVLRLSDIASGCIFDPILGRVAAEVLASIKIGFGPFSFTEEVTIADITLVDFSFGCEAILSPVTGLARIDANDLLLHMGPEASLRVIDGQVGSDDNETYRVNIARDEDGNVIPGMLSVVYSGFFQEFSDSVDRITASGGDENDAIVLEDAITTPLEASGNDGDDILDGAAGNDTLNGNDGNDRLFGRDGNDTLLGGDGDDVLEGGAGADVIDGGADFDKVSYEDSAEGVTFVVSSFSPLGVSYLGSGGDAEGDVLTDIEYIVGSNFDDILFANPLAMSTLVGRGGADMLVGGGADDFLLGETGADTMIGGSGRDATSYLSSLGAVIIDLQAGTATGGDAQGDILDSIEDVQGSAYYDVLRGTSGANRLGGFLGEDIIDGRGGDDEITGHWGDDHIYAYGDGAQLDGGADRDLLDYSNATNFVTVDLAAGVGLRNGQAQIDAIAFRVIVEDDDSETITDYSTFEDLTGSIFGDILSGDIGANTIRGQSGLDTINGRAGDDLIIGGAGADILNGGDGRDWADYTDGFGVTVALNGALGVGSTAAGDVLSNIENLRGSDGTDVLIGNSDDNTLAPELSRGVGEDVVTGGDAADNSIDTMILDYSRSDVGQGLTGGYISDESGRFQRLTSDGLAVLDGVNFNSIEQFVITGTYKDDDIIVGDGDDKIYLGGGNDTVDAGTGADVVLVQEDDDAVTYASGEGGLADGPFYLNGGSGTDILSIDLSTLSEDVVILAGEDRFANAILPNGAVAIDFEELAFAGGGSGDDIIDQTGSVDNVFDGGDGEDTLLPGRGIDAINGGRDFTDSAGYLFTEQGVDYFDIINPVGILLNLGDHMIVDYSDVDAVITSDSNRVLRSRFDGEDIGQVSTALLFSSTFGTIETDDGSDAISFDNIERLTMTGGDFDDLLTGTWCGSAYQVAYSTGEIDIDVEIALPTGRGADVIRGGAGDDTIIGMTGSDELFGDAGEDVLIGSDPSMANGQPAGTPDEPLDIYELDQLTGGADADRFVAGVAGLTEGTVLYLGRPEDATDAQDARAIITDFDAAEGDVLQLAGTANDYLVEVTETGVFILFNDDVREIIVELNGLSDFDLSADYVDYVGGTVLGPIIIDPIIVDPTTFTPTFPINFDPTFPVTTISNGTPFATSAQVLRNGEFREISQPLEIAQRSTLDDMASVVAPMVSLTDTPQQVSLEAASDGWVTQTNDTGDLLAAMFGAGTDPALTSGTLTLEGDGRAFGTFDGDPFGLGSGIVLSTGQVEDLDGENTEDGGLFGPYSPDLEFVAIGEFEGSTIFRANLSGLGFDINSLTLRDDGDAVGGSTGRLSGTDLDAIVISRDYLDAVDASTNLNDTTVLSRLDVFDFSAIGTTLTPGSQRSPSDPNLQGSVNGIVDVLSATPDAFDFGGTTNSGFVTLGDGGSIGFDLTAPVETNFATYLYVAEAGANEELDLDIAVSTTRLNSPNDLSTDFGAAGAEGDHITLTYEFPISFDNAGDFLIFDFALLSEELREYAGSAFNDAFRVSLNGIQLAQLSDGAAATVNALQPAPFAVSHPDLNLNPVGTGPAAMETRADAFTDILHFAGQTQLGLNELKIEVQDVRDGLMDSAILIRGNSFDLDDNGGTAINNPRVEFDGIGSTLTEGAPAVAVPVSLTGVANLSAPVTLTFTPGTADIDLGSGAGLDHAVALNPGDGLSFDLMVSAPQDGIVEGTEFVVATVAVTSTITALDGLAVAPMLFQVDDAATREFEITIGDAPVRFSRRDPDAWRDAWTDDRLEIGQKQDVADANWTPVDLGTSSPGTFGGSGLFRGDLGVSGRTTTTEAPPQEIDGTEALRFLLADGFIATGIDIDLDRFRASDDGAGRDEAGRVTFLDDLGTIVATEYLDAGDGDSFQFNALPGFSEVVFEAGARDAANQFVHGALDDGTAPDNDFGSGFLIDTLAFYGDEIL